MTLTHSLKAAASPINETAGLGPLIDAISEARFVLIGEATHGTEEFYRTRAHITQRLIAEHGFAAVAVEADWPDAFRANRYVRHHGVDHSAPEALGDFRRFPVWMWRNHVVAGFLEWLKTHNHAGSARRRVGFYGLDVYSMHSSMRRVLGYLEQVDPQAARLARDRYGCFDRFEGDPHLYGRVTTLGVATDCEKESLAQLTDMLRRRGSEAAALSTELSARANGASDARSAELDPMDDEAAFDAAQNARVVRDAEAYYRAQFLGNARSWNLRDTHMADTLDELLTHLRHLGHARPRVVVWAHNSHLGDARATDRREWGELNLGQLMRERHPGECQLIGFTTYDGSVTAASAWDEPAELKRVRPALRGSYEELFHTVGWPAFHLDLRRLPKELEPLAEPRLHRAIGVIYRPETERVSHYYQASMPQQFDHVIHIDRTQALRPLDRSAGEVEADEPETFPTGL